MTVRPSPRPGRPLVFLDVDGPLLPFGEDPRGASPATPPTPEVGRRLAALPGALVWATTWEERANTDLAPRLGLPRLPVVTWPEPTGQDEREDRWVATHHAGPALLHRVEPYRGLADEDFAALDRWLRAR
ncbi:hypothetical protein HII36_10930 [Nonomuraea sp. NN258]|uniref:hypothetical protein n=1 Tax=Nonomuraea antri TaxID=2730852 RepID=UPI0015688BFA|nr:hypothetical protein [Nonomuraea antri]NRQ32348.1 hypothetical protein [Nonomuraea antri]